MKTPEDITLVAAIAILIIIAPFFAYVIYCLM